MKLIHYLLRYGFIFILENFSNPCDAKKCGEICHTTGHKYPGICYQNGDCITIDTIFPPNPKCGKFSKPKQLNKYLISIF